MQLELVAQVRLGLCEFQLFEEKEEGFDGGVVARRLHAAQPVASGPGDWQAHAAAPRLDSVEHAQGLAPVPVEEDELHVFGRGRLGGDRLAARVEHPEFAAWLHDVLALRRRLMAVHMVACRGDEPVDEASGAGGPPVLAVMDEHIDLHGQIERFHAFADAPSGRQVTALTTWGAFEDNASRHGSATGWAKPALASTSRVCGAGGRLRWHRPLAAHRPVRGLPLAGV